MPCASPRVLNLLSSRLPNGKQDPLPAGWQERATAEGRLYYVCPHTRTTQVTQLCPRFCGILVIFVLFCALNTPAPGVSLHPGLRTCGLVGATLCCCQGTRIYHYDYGVTPTPPPTPPGVTFLTLNLPAVNNVSHAKRRDFGESWTTPFQRHTFRRWHSLLMRENVEVQSSTQGAVLSSVV